jgi:mannose-1-phosphate guanylyltransferase/mannose-6-phosphate isomerase
MSGLIQPVIMAGGSGTRLWQLSRAGYPKQFLVLLGNESLLQQAEQRLAAVCGTAAPIVVGNRQNQSTYISLGEVHRLANPGKVWLEIIEVQSGSYLGEDDIVRFEETYGRLAT